jgi:hypothetical protein
VIDATVTTTSLNVITSYPPSVQKRSATIDPPGRAITNPPSRLSSACSCLITAPATTTYIATTTIGTTSTATATATASVDDDTPLYCGIRSYSNDHAGQNERFEADSAGLSFEACKAACMAREGCLSFAYGDAYDICYTEQVDVQTLYQQGNYDPQYPTPWAFYDLGCPHEIIFV